MLLCDFFHFLIAFAAFELTQLYLYTKCILNIIIGDLLKRFSLLNFLRV